MSNEQEKLIRQAFMIAMARKLYRDGVIDAHKLNRLLIRIEKSIGKCDKT